MSVPDRLAGERGLPRIARPLSIFVAGGTGFVGEQLVVRLVRRGHQLRVITRDASHADELLPLSSVEVAAGPVYDMDFLRRRLQGCDVAVNLIGVLNARGWGGRGFRQAHVEFTLALLRAMREAGVKRLLHVSALNADAANGRSHYLRTKGEAEDAIRRAPGVEWTIFRPSVIFGSGDSLTTRFTKLLRRSGGWLPLACPRARFAPIHVADVATAILHALHRPDSIGRTYELCGPQVLTLEEIVRLSAAAAGQRCRILPLPSALGWLQGAALGSLPGQPFSLDNFHSLSVDSVCRQSGCEELGIQPASLAALAPLWLAPRR